MYLSPKCCDRRASSSDGSSSSDPPPDIEIRSCSEARCMDGVMARNYRIEWDWPAPIYPGEVVLSTDDNPFTPDYWHVKTYGSVCTHKYNTGGWIVKYVGGQPAGPGASGALPHCAWESDERLPEFVYATGDEGPATVGYPLTCRDIPTRPLVTMTLGYDMYEPLYSGYDFIVYIWSPVTGSPTYPAVRLRYVGRTVSDDGIKNDCMAAQLLEASPHPVYYNMTYPSGIEYEGGGTVFETPFTFNGAFYDPTYTFDPNAIGPDEFPSFWRRCPLIPLTLTVTPA